MRPLAQLTTESSNSIIFASSFERYGMFTVVSVADGLGYETLTRDFWRLKLLLIIFFYIFYLREVILYVYVVRSFVVACFVCLLVRLLLMYSISIESIGRMPVLRRRLAVKEDGIQQLLHTQWPGCARCFAFRLRLKERYSRWTLVLEREY